MTGRASLLAVAVEAACEAALENGYDREMLLDSSTEVATDMLDRDSEVDRLARARVAEEESAIAVGEPRMDEVAARVWLVAGMVEAWRNRYITPDQLIPEAI